MNDELEATARLVSWACRGIVRTRATSSICLDSDPVFAIAMCRIVGEERPQGVACGSTDNPPALVLDWQANSRDISFLEPFAGALDDYVSSALAAGRLPRVWISDDIAFGCLELLARRYHRNAGATELIQRLGWICEAYTQEAAYPGQQAIIRAVDLLRQHVITGHSAIDDLHLEAMLTWLDPTKSCTRG